MRNQRLDVGFRAIYKRIFPCAAQLKHSEDLLLENGWLVIRSRRSGPRSAFNWVNVMNDIDVSIKPFVQRRNKYSSSRSIQRRQKFALIENSQHHQKMDTTSGDSMR